MTRPSTSSPTLDAPIWATAPPANLLVDVVCRECGTIARRILTAGSDPYCTKHREHAAILVPHSPTAAERAAREGWSTVYRSSLDGSLERRDAHGDVVDEVGQP